MKVLNHALLIVLIAVLSGGQNIALADKASNPGNNRGGVWASSAEPVTKFLSVGSTEILAPNGLFSILYTKEGVYLLAKEKRTLLKAVVEIPPVTEVLWANNSEEFAITGSDGGLVGTWDVHYYGIKGDGIPVEHDIRQLITPYLKSLPKCDDSETMNIGAIGWGNNDNELLVVAEVPPHSPCHNMGALVGFRISVVKWKVEERLSEVVLRSKWKSDLGNRFAAQNRE